MKPALRKAAVRWSRLRMPALVLAAALGVGCGKNGDVTGGGGPLPEADTTGFVALDLSLPADTLRLASLNMSIGFPVAELIFKDMSIDSVAYNTLMEKFLNYQKGQPAERIKAMAGEIVRESLDVVGLQEVMTLRKSGTLANDFLSELRAAIVAQGGPAYTAYRTVLNDTLLSGSKGDSSIVIEFQEGNALLVRPGFAVLDSSRHPFRTLFTIPLENDTVISERAVDHMRLRSPRGIEFQVFNTHLEVRPDARVSQGVELALLANSLQRGSVRAGRQRGQLQVVLADLNSLPGSEAHVALREYGFVDTFDPSVAQDSGMTCCVDRSALWDPAADVIDRRIDYVMARGLVDRVLSRTRVKGAYTAADGTSFLASDHRMVVAHIVAQ